MSEYVKMKVIRLPLTNDILKSFHVENKCKLGEQLSKIEIWEDWDRHKKKEPYFNFAPTTSDYIDLVIDYQFAEPQEFAYSWQLNEQDIKKYKPYFDMLGFQYDVSNLRKVAYCWYDGVEAPDCYDVFEPTWDNI